MTRDPLLVETLPAVCRLAGLLTLWLHVTHAQSESATNATASRLASTRGRYEVCISSWTPMVYCDESNISQSSMTGYQVELVRSLAASLNWTYGSMYYFRCMDWSLMLADMTSPNGTCFMAAAGLAAQAEYLDQGIRFAFPNYNTGGYGS